MDKPYVTAGLIEAKANYAAARAVYDAAKVGSRKWRGAADDLQFHQNKVAFFEVEAARFPLNQVAA